MKTSDMIRDIGALQNNLLEQATEQIYERLLGLLFIVAVDPKDCSIVILESLLNMVDDNRSKVFQSFNISRLWITTLTK